jgi:hypothetical protein
MFRSQSLRVRIRGCCGFSGHVFPATQPVLGPFTRCDEMFRALNEERLVRGHRISIRLPKSWPYRNKPSMRFFRGNRFALIFFVLLIFSSAMVVRQFMVNQSRHVELRESFILLYSKGYRQQAERLFKRLMRELETVPNKALMDDYQRTLMLVDPAKQDQDNFIWKYHWTVSNELEKRSEGTLQRALKMAEEEK